MDYKIFIDFIYNVSLILGASVIYMLIPKKHFEPGGIERYIYGVIVSIIGIIIMSNPYVVSPGIQFDARSLIVACSAMFLGIIPATIVTITASAYRLIIGGDGAIVGVMVILSSAILGSLWRILFFKKLIVDRRKRFLNLYLTGLVVHIAYLACLVALPNGMFMNVFTEVHITLLAVYPIGLLILGLVLFSQYDKFESLKELKETRDTLYTYIEEAPYGIFIANNEGRYIDANKKALEMSGYTRKELCNLTTMDLNADNSTYEQKNSFLTVKKEGFVNIDINCITKDKGIRTWNVNAVRLDADKVVGFVKDVTDEYRLREEKAKIEIRLRNQQKLESVGLLAGGVAHEINNPLNGVLNYGQLILDSEEASQEIQGYASEIIYESNRIAGIVKNLLSFSRQGEASFIPAKPYDLISNTVTLIKTIVKGDQINLEVETDSCSRKNSVVCKSQQIQQVILNLMTNARDALNEKYDGYHEDKVMKISCKAEEIKGEKVMVIRVRDNGNGIKKEVAEKIFDPFFTTKGRNVGTGLGLAISYGIIKDHGGEIGFTTKVGEFTEFFIMIPIAHD